MDDKEKRRRICREPDFIAIGRFDYSLAKLVARYPEGAPDNVIAQALMIEEEEVEILYDTIVLKLRDIMRVE